MHAEINPWQPARFPAHGEVQIDWNDRLLLIQARGPFNAELMVRGTTAIADLRAARPADGRYVELVHWQDSMLMPPEAWVRFEKAVRLFVSAGLNGTHTLCVAAPEVEARWLMLPRMVALWEESRPVELFEQLEPALARARELTAEPPASA
ncbi:hypothetical protein [Inhella proteolytica]|uniref:Uncharacterized protein n=1 Tax=Inhella proteolytica TaxID=2795029 RepID=A0A931J420_9BURK|nr:hypothetical protein [Inhella proteolytica]MBH9579219.1 hypothetical protein [Inhella proteolytica]